MTSAKNPVARAGAIRVKKIKAIGKPLDPLNPTSSAEETQSVSAAVRSVMRRAPVSIYHARVICELYGLGGRG